MNAYILGAGVSKCVGYPVGTELFDEIDKYVRESGNLTDRFNYRDDWNDLRTWLETNTDPAIAQAYRTKNIEHLFTILDFAAELRNGAFLSVAFAGCGSEERAAQSVAFEAFDPPPRQQLPASVAIYFGVCPPMFASSSTQAGPSLEGELFPCHPQQFPTHARTRNGFSTS
jgi:hypothetical protein